MPASTEGSTAGRPPGSPPPTPLTAAARWQRALADLDAARARAFATRDPAALRRVYSAAPLATADAALLRRLVPAGCGLRGVRTRYTHVVVRAAGGRASVLVTATLPPSQLVCGGRSHAAVPGAGPTRLRVRLVATADGPRIAGQTVVDG